MGKSESKRKSHIVLLIVIYFLALCFGIGVALSFGQKGNVAAPVPTDDAVAQKQYTFGQTYTIDGKQYTLGEKENEYMDYYTALGLSREEYIVSLTKYTYLDGTDRTEGTTAVRNAGTYEFEIEPLNGEVEIYSDIVTVAAQRVIVDVNRIGAFVNAENSSQWPAHGDKNVIYQHNDGWYAAAIGDKAIVNTRTVTNATYGKGAVNIRIKNEILTGDEIVAAEGHAGYTLNWSEIWKEGAKGWADVEWDNIDLKATSWTSKHPGSTNSIYRYNDGTKNVNIGITSRIGTSFDKTGEYVASFTFNAPDNYVFDYSDESKLYDEYKGLNVPESNRGTNSFVLTKYWYILESGGTIGVRGYWNGGETFVPFATGSGSILDYDHTDYTTPDNEKKYLIVDSISYGDVIHTNEPNVDEGETLTFEIEFEPVNGTGKKKIRELTGYVPAAKWKYIGQVGSKYKWEEESYTIPEGKEASTLPYYFNSSMPAGKYTLYLYLDKPGSARLSGIYTLTVLPKSFDSIALNQGEENPLTALHNVIRGQETSNGSGQYRNSYAVGTKKVHEDITGALAKLNAKLLYYNKSSRIGYWASTDSDDYNDLYDNAVTIMYSRGDGYGGSADFSLSDILGSLTLPNTYTMYYSISAKNYVTAGGARSGDFDHYGFMLWLFDGYNIKDIYDMMNETNGRYFQGGKYTGNQVTTTPYTNNYFDADYDFDDSNVDYVNAGKAYVRLTLKDKSNTYWDTSKLAHADEKVGWFEEYYSDYFKFDGDDLLVYYTISPADNEWTIAPQMATWNYDSFNKANNNITGKLKFDVTNKSDVKFRIGKKTEAGGFVWLKLTSALANNTISYTFDSEGTQFVVDESGQVGDDIAAALKQFDVGTYYLESHVPAIKKSNSDTVNVKEFTLDKDNYIEITVAQTQNSWATIPYVIGWAYQGFDTSNFNAGVPYYFVTSGEVVEYALYEGSDTSGEGRPLTVTRTQAQEGGEDTYSLSQDTVAYLNGLSAKQYTVVASYKGTDNYADMSLSIFFSVAQAQNNWTQAPYMIGWAYDNFSAGNFQSGTARFKNNADIQYTLYKQVEKPVAGEQGKTETVSEPIDGWNSFTEIDESIERKFNALGAGDYKLVASLTGTTDYADLSLDILFSVSQTQNSWKVGYSPYMLGWAYTGFKSGTGGNFQAGIPFYNRTAGEVVTYTLYEGTDTSITDKYKFTFTDIDGYISGEGAENSDANKVVNKFKALPAKTYTLVAFYKGTADYADLSLDMVFSVTQVQNTWQTPPSVIGWTYGANAANLFTPGVPNFPESNPTVNYTLYKTVQQSEQKQWGPISDEATVKSNIADLGAGQYRLYVKVDSTTDYTVLELSVSFNVEQAQNTWTVTPAVIGWTFGANPANLFTAGVPAFPKNNAKVSYTLSKVKENETDSDFTPKELSSEAAVTAELKDLGAGKYELVAAVTGTPDYTALSLTVSFNVAQAQNTWTVTPAVIGWTYGGYDAKFFTAGVPSFPTESYEVQYTLTKDGKSSAEWTKTEKSDIDSAFNTLGAGGYTLVAEVVGNTNYTGLRLSITFNVAKAQNSWKNGKAPFITGWAYRGFVASTNFQGGEDSRTGEGEKTVVYSLYSGTEHTTKPDGWEQTFTSIGAVESKFEALPVGTYNLHAFLVGDDNYEDLELYIVFSVSKADNSWPTAPVMVGWQYRGLTAEIAKSNFRAAKARFDEQPETNKITYTVTSGIQTADTEEQAELMSINLEVDQYGRLTSDTIQELNEKLIVGGYTLEVALTGTNNYKDLSVSVPFNITQAANGWATIPTISSWTYGDTYNDKSLDSVEIVEGKATLGNVKYTVQYVDSYGTVGDNVENFEDLAFKKIQDSDEDGLKEKLLGGTVAGLVGLDAGSYNLHVEVKETTDYAAISRDIRFTVSKAENGWDIVPTISGWTFGEKPKSHNNPKPNVETGNQIQYKYYAAKNEGGQSVDYDREIVDLSAAFAGDYAMVVTLTGNKNYNNLVEIVYFTIAKQEIKWDEATAPERVEWYLSEADNLADNALTKVAVKTASGQTVVSYTLSYAISKAVGSSYNPVTTVSVTVNGAERDLDALLSALKALEAGIYRIVITAILGADGNFDLQPLTVGVEVKLSEPTIEEDPSGGSGGSGSRVYNWNWGDSDEQKTLSDMKVSQEGAVITYRIGFESTWSTEYDNFATMLKDLRAKDAGTYTVEYIVRCENYATITRTVTVNISAATNDWEKKFNNSIDTNISWTWKEFVSTLLQMPKAYYGNEFVLYTILKNDVAFTTFRASDYTEGDDEKTSYERLFDAFVNAVKDWNAGKYRVTVSIDKTTNYSACSFTYTFTINKVTTVWDSDTAGTNGSSITESYGSTFADLNEPVSGSDWGKKALYTLKFSSASDALYSGDSWSALIARLRECEAEEDDYTITAFIDGDDNHMALNYSITVKITVQGNSWKEQTGSADNPSSKRIEWTYGSNVAPNIVFVPTYNASKLIVKVGTALTDGIEVPYANLIDYIKGLDVGTYTITASVDADKKYGGLSDTVYLTIIKANNAWEGDLTISGWTWNKVESEISFTLNLPVPKYSASAKVYVYQISNLEEAVITANITYADGKVNVNDYNALVLKLKGLNVATGGYRIEVVADEQPNYNECRGQTKDFTIAQAENRWTTKPVLIVDGEREDGPKYTWVYRTKVTYEATALFGDVIVKFTDTATGDDDYVTIPTEIGTYKATFLVAATGNYKGVAKYELEFTITGVTDRSFSVLPGVTGWAWHNYSRSTNLFVGTPTSGGKVTFKILSQDGSKKIEFELVNEDGTGAGVYVPKDKLDELNDLTAGTYRLILSVGSRDFYTAFEYEVSFTVVEADNDWTVLPQIANWTYGDYQEEINKPIAESRYGTPTIIITARDSEDDVYYNGIDINRLEDALVGWYVMTVSVDGSRGRYKAKEEIVIQFQVFANTDQNYWEDVPRIEGWTANIDEIVNLPSGQPHYGKPYFEFYNAQLVNDEYVRGGPIEDGVDSILISNSMYARDFYMPTKPGVYIMLAFAENGVDSKDDLTENHFSGVVFTIRDRVIEWTQNVRIASVLYLGEKNKWAEPTAKTNLTGIDKVDITYRYLDALTRRDLGSQIPTEVGKYIVVARANARYTQYITSEMMFDVMLSKNSWVGDELPTIGSWSEEFNSKSPNPMGEALHGNIFYMYIDKANPDIILTEKPTKAGNYIMIARVELDGYETLEARYEFTIEPAYDSTFVVIDIILGLVACVFAVVVIVFAIRRYKENG
ncbi:MAG: hypothetical protein J1F69_02175 [Clostridiales bacterium]|nr:hypothetical protein [Clostridiales bacterium]